MSPDEELVDIRDPLRALGLEHVRSHAGARRSTCVGRARPGRAVQRRCCAWRSRPLARVLRGPRCRRELRDQRRRARRSPRGCPRLVWPDRSAPGR